MTCPGQRTPQLFRNSKASAVCSARGSRGCPGLLRGWGYLTRIRNSISCARWRANVRTTKFVRSKSRLENFGQGERSGCSCSPASSLFTRFSLSCSFCRGPSRRLSPPGGHGLPTCSQLITRKRLLDPTCLREADTTLEIFLLCDTSNFSHEERITLIVEAVPSGKS